jgi:hypothetical protein
MKTIKIIMVFLSVALLLSCQEKDKPFASGQINKDFSAANFTVKDGGVKKVKGQVLYVPIYSNIPCRKQQLFDLSAFIAIHNTDLESPIKIAKVLYFDNDGKLVKDFTQPELSLPPLAATNFFIPRSDKSGTGANFLVEWIAEEPVTEPLIESLMLNCETHQSLSFPSRGQVIRETP